MNKGKLIGLVGVSTLLVFALGVVGGQEYKKRQSMMVGKGDSDVVDTAEDTDINLSTGNTEKLDNAEGDKSTGHMVNIESMVEEDISSLPNKKLIEQGIEMNGDALSLKITPNQPTVMGIELDSRDSLAVEDLEEVIVKVTGITYNIPEGIRNKKHVEMEVTRSEEGKYKIKVVEIVLGK